MNSAINYNFNTCQLIAMKGMGAEMGAIVKDLSMGKVGTRSDWI